MYTLKNIKESLGNEYKIIGDENAISFDNVMPLNEATPNSLSWLSPVNLNPQSLIDRSNANVILCSLKQNFEKQSNKILIQVKNPRLIFLRVLKKLFISKTEFGVHSSCVIDKEAIISKDVYIGPNTVIGKCTIGQNVIIHGNCFLFDKVVIGDNVTIMPNTTIGGVGFGYEKNEEGEFELFPHLGGVIIENDVEIGSNTCIDRGTLGDTFIGRGTKIDNLVHISHNVKIGANSAIIAHAMIGGSTSIDENSWIAPCASVRDRISIGKNTTIGLGSVVVKNIPDNEIWFGNPALKKLK